MKLKLHVLRFLAVMFIWYFYISSSSFASKLTDEIESNLPQDAKQSLLGELSEHAEEDSHLIDIVLDVIYNRASKDLSLTFKNKVAAIRKSRLHLWDQNHKIVCLIQDALLTSDDISAWMCEPYNGKNLNSEANWAVMQLTLKYDENNRPLSLPARQK